MQNKNLKKLLLLILLSFPSLIHCSGYGQQIGNFYYYEDDQCGSYTIQSVGNFNYVTGPNGYSGTGQQVGNFYYYND